MTVNKVTAYLSWNNMQIFSQEGFKLSIYNS
jgi:hypothetical protein